MIYEDAKTPVKIYFEDGEIMTGLAYLSHSQKTYYVFYDDTSMDSFRLNKNGSWRCLGTNQKKCHIENNDGPFSRRERD